MGKYYDVEKDLREASKFLQSDKIGTVQIGNQWITKSEKESYSPDRINALFDQIYKDPKYKGSVESYAWNKAQTTDQNAYLQAKGIKSAQEFNINAENLKLLESAINSGDKSKVLAAQKSLKDAGYDIGKVDGQVGKHTKEAFDLFKQSVEKQNQSLKNNTQNLSSLEPQQIKSMMFKDALQEHETINRNGFSKLFGHTQKIDVEANPYTKLAMQGRNMMEAATRIAEQMVLPPNPGIFTPDVSQQETRNIAKSYSDINTNLQKTNNVLNSDRKALSQATGLNINEEVQAELQRIKHDASVKGQLDPVKYQQELAKRGKWWTDTFRDKGNIINSHYETMTGQEALISASAKSNLDLQKQTIEGMYDGAAKLDLFNEEKTKPIVDDYYNRYKQPNQSREDFIKEALSAKDSDNNRFVTTKVRGTKTGTTTDITGNAAKEMFAKVNKQVNNKLDDAINKTIITNRYVQPDKTMPMGLLSNAIEQDFKTGNSYGYGINGTINWTDNEGKSADLPKGAALSNISVETVRNDMGNKYRITGEHKGKRYTMLSDIPITHNEMVIQASRSEAMMMFQNGEQNKGYALARQALVSEHGGLKLPQVGTTANKLNINAQKLDVQDVFNNNLNLVIANKPSTEPINIKGYNLYVKAIGDGVKPNYAIFGKGADGREKLIPIKEGKIVNQNEFEYGNVDQALNEIAAYATYTDDNAKIKTETIKKSRTSSSAKVNVSGAAQIIFGNSTTEE